MEIEKLVIRFTDAAVNTALFLFHIGVSQHIIAAAVTKIATNYSYHVPIFFGIGSPFIVVTFCLAGMALVAALPSSMAINKHRHHLPAILQRERKRNLLDP